MALNWDDSLLLGFEEIDSQHRAIFDYFDKLSNAGQQGEPEKNIEEMALFLLEYSHGHFEAEEKIMLEHKYPDLESQRFEHDKFRSDAEEIKKRIEEEGVTRAIAIDTIAKLIKWLLQHIRKHDRKMVEYLKERIVQ